MRIDLMDQAIGQGQIADGVVILMAVEIISIVGESLSQSMTIIEHRRDAIETETIKMELLQPVLAVGEEEMDDIILAIVEAKTIPGRMLVPKLPTSVSISRPERAAEESSLTATRRST